MKEIVVLSGKGGTGKTSLVAAFAGLAENAVLCDADVDAADLHLLLDPRIKERHAFVAGHAAVIERSKCTRCDRCRELCRWQAISAEYEVNPLDCEGCGVCVHFCPEQAIGFPEKTCGEWYSSETRFGPLVHAQLGIAEENSGKLVSLVRREALRLAEDKGRELILTDGPPGIGCPVIASMGGAEAVVVVTEPTVSGKHDLERVIQLARHFRVTALICINKYDLNLRQCAAIEDYAWQAGVPILGYIPFDRSFTEAMVQGKTILECNGRSRASLAAMSVWQSIRAVV